MYLNLQFIAFFFLQADHFDRSGKMNAVIAVVAVVLLGIFLFLIYLERRIKKLENDLND